MACYAHSPWHAARCTLHGRNNVLRESDRLRRAESRNHHYRAKEIAMPRLLMVRLTGDDCGRRRRVT